MRRKLLIEEEFGVYHVSTSEGYEASAPNLPHALAKLAVATGRPIKLDVGGINLGVLTQTFDHLVHARPDGDRPAST